VSRIRACATAETPQSHTKLGVDGRLRPLNSAARRRPAAAMINGRECVSSLERPASRQRQCETCDSVPTGVKTPVHQPAEDLDSSTACRLVRKPGNRRMRLDRQVDRRLLVAKLTNDPSLKFNEASRRTLRWLHQPQWIIPRVGRASALASRTTARQSSSTWRSAVPWHGPCWPKRSNNDHMMTIVERRAASRCRRCLPQLVDHEQQRCGRTGPADHHALSQQNSFTQSLINNKD
jgi:hypothetical protein